MLRDLRRWRSARTEGSPRCCQPPFTFKSPWKWHVGVRFDNVASRSPAYKNGKFPLASRTLYAEVSGSKSYVSPEDLEGSSPGPNPLQYSLRIPVPLPVWNYRFNLGPLAHVGATYSTALGRSVCRIILDILKEELTRRIVTRYALYSYPTRSNLG